MLISISFNEGIGDSPKNLWEKQLEENLCSSMMGPREDQGEEKNLHCWKNKSRFLQSSVGICKMDAQLFSSWKPWGSTW